MAIVYALVFLIGALAAFTALIFLASLISRATGRNVKFKGRTTSFTVGPFRTASERKSQKEKYKQQEIISALNAFCDRFSEGNSYFRYENKETSHISPDLIDSYHWLRPVRRSLSR